VCLPLAKRPDVRSVIGDAAEMIAFANCVMDRASFDGLIGAFNCVVRDSFLFCY
jgi:ABC-type glucose/galactose transport system permease subunit